MAADIIIRGMEMPKEAKKIIISADGSVWDNAWPTRGYMRMKNVYAVPLPEGHGRLIDASALYMQLHRMYHGAISDSEIYVYEVLGMISNAPTIVPAEGGNDDA